MKLKSKIIIATTTILIAIFVTITICSLLLFSHKLGDEVKILSDLTIVVDKVDYNSERDVIEAQVRFNNPYPGRIKLTSEDFSLKLSDGSTSQSIGTTLVLDNVESGDSSAKIYFNFVPLDRVTHIKVKSTYIYIR